MFILVNSRDKLPNRFSLVPGGLHIAFAIAQTVRNYVNVSYIPETKTQLNWFGQNTVKQVLECKWIKLSLNAHEIISVVLSILHFKDFMIHNSEILTSQEFKISVLKSDSHLPKSLFLFIPMQAFFKNAENLFLLLVRSPFRN